METLNQFIADYRKYVSSLEEEIKIANAKLEIARAKLEGMEEILSEVQKNKISLSPVVLDNHTVHSTQLHYFDGSAEVEKRQRRALSPQWRAILSFVAERGAASLDDIDNVDPRIERKLIRAQLSYYAKQGLVTKEESTGKYSLTESGIAACGFRKDQSPNAGNEGALDLV